MDLVSKLRDSFLGSQFIKEARSWVCIYYGGLFRGLHLFSGSGIRFAFI